MDVDKASQTAEIMARHRAAELQFPENQRVCNDPYAIYFVSEDVRKAFKKPLRSMLIRLWVNWMFPGVHMPSFHGSDTWMTVLQDALKMAWSRWSSLGLDTI